jgi:hypothetical protein
VSLTALHNAIQQGIVRALGIRGDYPMAVQPALGVGCQLLDLEGPEYWYLRGGRRFHQGINLGATAAQFAFVELVPVFGGKIFVIEELLISGAAGTFAGIAFGSAVAAGTLRQGHPSDDRSPVPVVPTSVGSGLAFNFGFNATPVVPAANAQIALNPTYQRFGPFILSGNANLTIICSNVNTALQVYAHWRERNALPSERA